MQRLPLRQWVLKITDYADRLEAGLDGLDWPAGTLTAQQQWIGKSQGCNIDFGIEGMDDEVGYHRSPPWFAQNFGFYEMTMSASLIEYKH